MKILDAIWFTEMGEVNPIGIVIMETEVGEKKAYMGKSIGATEAIDILHIAERGAKVSKEILKSILAKLEG